MSLYCWNFGFWIPTYENNIRHGKVIHDCTKLLQQLWILLLVASSICRTSPKAEFTSCWYKSSTLLLKRLFFFFGICSLFSLHLWVTETLKLLLNILHNLVTRSDSTGQSHINLPSCFCYKHSWYLQCTETSLKYHTFQTFWLWFFLYNILHLVLWVSTVEFRKCLNLLGVSNISYFCCCYCIASLDCSHPFEHCCLDQLFIGFYSGIGLSTTVIKKVNSYIFFLCCQ